MINVSTEELQKMSETREKLKVANSLEDIKKSTIMLNILADIEKLKIDGKFDFINVLQTLTDIHEEYIK